jgi:bacillithiol biosynthesis cysteine-adding enzyme BshC
MEKPGALELQYLPADVFGLADWSARTLAERPAPAHLPGIVVPDTLDSFPRPPERHEPESRAELATTLERELAPYQPHVAVLESVRAIKERGACFVIAGQQPGLLGGPLYNIYKALHAIVLARALSRVWETSVVPLFWNHADDHDLAEVHHLWIQNPNLDLRKVSLAGVSSGRTPLSELAFSAEHHKLGTLTELLRQNLWEGPEQARALELFLPRDGETFAGAFTRLLLALFGHQGLVVLEPQWIRARTSPVLAQLVTLDLESALASGAKIVRQQGREPAIEPAEAALVFRTSEKKRHALRLARGAFRYDGESGERNAVELAAEIVAAPAEWSPGALLRPIVQDLALPVAAYVGGWGELAYHAQLPPLRDFLGVPHTPFVPRLSATLVEASARESLAKLGLSVRDVLLARGEIEPPQEEAQHAGVTQELRAVARRAGEELLARREAVAAIDRGLAQQVKRTADQITDTVDKLAQKLERVLQNSSGTGRRHYRRLANGLFPNGAPQERVRGALEFTARYGTGWIDELLQGIDPLPTEHLVVFLPDGGAP